MMYDRASIKLSEFELLDEVLQTTDIIKKHGQEDVKWFLSELLKY
jgi:hypothetical protein